MKIEHIAMHANDLEKTKIYGKLPVNGEKMMVLYKAKPEKDIRYPLKCGLDLFGGKWKSALFAFWPQRAACATAKFEMKC